MNEKEKIQVMAATVQPIIDLIQSRLDTRLDLLQTLAIQPLDSIPESIKNKREDECSKIRAVVQEQRDLLATIKTLFPISVAGEIKTETELPTNKRPRKKTVRKNA